MVKTKIILVYDRRKNDGIIRGYDQVDSCC